MLSSVIVTREMLIADNACAPSIHSFDLGFPKGSATLEQIANDPLCHRDWLGWLAVNASFVTEDIAMELIPLSNNLGKYYGKAAVYAHWVTAETGPELIAKSSDRVGFARLAIRYAKWMTPEIKAELIAKYGD
jgi:hypothetical protein